MQVATRLAGQYRFPRYDVLFLPASFPHGGRVHSSPMRGTTLISGMENACLTFLSPALLTGDGSTVDTCAHELCHVSDRGSRLGYKLKPSHGSATSLAAPAGPTSG